MNDDSASRPILMEEQPKNIFNLRKDKKNQINIQSIKQQIDEDQEQEDFQLNEIDPGQKKRDDNTINQALKKSLVEMVHKKPSVK